MKTSIVAALAVFSVLPIFQANAQQITKASADPFKQQLTVQISNGVTVIADKATQTIYLTDSSGQIAEVSFVDAIAAAEPDPSKRTAMLDEFKSSLSDPGYIMTVIAPRVATDTTYWPRDTGGGGPPKHTNMLRKKYSDASLQDLRSLGGPCDLGPCSPSIFSGGPKPMYAYDGNGAGWGRYQGGGTLADQQLLIYDKQRWEHEREDACNDFWTGAAETTTLGWTAVGTCATFETGVGALACAGTYISYAISLYKTHKADSKCNASYPGPGNW